MASEVKEITSTPPIQLISDGSDLLDWSITGAAGGVGNIGPNRLDYNLLPVDTISNGHGGYISTSYQFGDATIPPGTAATDAYQRWIYVTTTRDGNGKIEDYRQKNYANCQWFGTLEPGTYKLIIEYINPYYWLYSTIAALANGENPYYTLFDSGGNILVDDTDFLDEADESVSPITFYRKVKTFTLSASTTVGLLSKIYPNSQDCAYRFMIFSADTPETSFTLSAYTATFSGDTCWQPYSIVIPLKIKSVSGGITSITIPINAPLQAGSSVSLASTGITIPTYYGRNTITCETDVAPSIYIKYKELEPIPMWAEERPAQISIYDIHEPQSGYDHNGIAILLPSEIISNKEDKGRWDLTLEHPCDEWGKWTYIVCQNVIKVNGQLYRIDETETILDADTEYISAHAKHITYDMADYWIEEAVFSAAGGEDYITQLNAHRVQDFPNQQPIVGEYVFDITSDLTGQMECQITDQSIIESIFGADNSLTSRYGGEVFRDNFHLSVNNDMEGAPEGNAFSIRYGTDLTKISFKIDMSEWVTNLIAVDNYGNMCAMWYDPAGSEWIIHHHKTKRVHFTYSDHAVNMAYMYDPAEWIGPGAEMTDDLARLITDALSYWETVKTPKISIVVNTAHIKGDPKYKDYIDLQNYDVGYKGTVYVEHLGIDVDMKIVSIRRNELTGEAVQLALGNTRASLIRQTVMSQTIVSPNSVAGKNTANNQTVQQELFNTQTALMSQNIDGMELFSISDLERRSINELEG